MKVSKLWCASSSSLWPANEKQNQVVYDLSHSHHLQKSFCGKKSVVHPHRSVTPLFLAALPLPEVHVAFRTTSAADTKNPCPLNCMADHFYQVSDDSKL